MKPEKIELPDSIGQWKLDGSPRWIDSSSIFDYMNGAGELYLAYHFDHLQVFEYKDKEGNDILVELYWMEDSRDAFGLLSLDWGGEAVDLGRPGIEEESIVPSSRALYGMGLLRLWSDNVYARVMAIQETPDAREVILQLGEIIISGRKNPLLPDMLKIIQPVSKYGWVLKKDRTAYFYSHLVLNSQYYLSHENILNLNQDTEAVLAVYEKNLEEKNRSRIHLLVIQYPDHEQAMTALESFIRAYLPEKDKKKLPVKNQKQQDFFLVEDGWMGYLSANHYLTLVFGSPDLESVRQIINQTNITINLSRRIS